MSFTDERTVLLLEASSLVLHKALCAPLLVGLVLFLCGPVVLAETVTLDFIDRGYYIETGSHSPTNQNYLVGDRRGVDGAGDYRNFFVFDLSAVTQPIASANLALTVPAEHGFDSIDPTENYELHDVVTPLATLLNGTGGVAAHADLGTGVVYGSRTMAFADEGTIVEISLNASAIAALNAATGQIAIGGSLATLNGDDIFVEAVFNGSGHVEDISQLRLTLVPEPSTAFLCIIGAFAAMRRRSRTSRL